MRDDVTVVVPIVFFLLFFLPRSLRSFLLRLPADLASYVISFVWIMTRFLLLLLLFTCHFLVGSAVHFVGPCRYYCCIVFFDETTKIDVLSVFISPLFFRFFVHLRSVVPVGWWDTTYPLAACVRKINQKISPSLYGGCAGCGFRSFFGCKWK